LGLAAAEILSELGIEAAVVNARFAKPMDRQMIEDACRAGAPVITVEDHSIAGGFGSAVLETIQELGLPSPRFQRLGIPAERFVSHGSRAGQLAECGFDATGIAAAVQKLLENEEAPLEYPRTRTLASR
jgi:1-deoxy-D-xylulose-5-phosphate synthase